MIYLKKVSTTKPVSGNIINSKNITDKEKNTYSAKIIDELISNNESGGTELTEEMIQSIVDRAVNVAKLASYPIGSYYWSEDPTDPSELFGGTWERIKDRFLYALGDEGNAGDEGGEATHVLTVNEMPSHTHTQNSHTHTYTDYYATKSTANDFNRSYVNTAVSDVGNTYTTRTSNGTTATNQNTGGGAAHNNMPPYVKAYCWKRVS